MVPEIVMIGTTGNQILTLTRLFRYLSYFETDTIKRGGSPGYCTNNFLNGNIVFEYRIGTDPDLGA